MPSKAMLALPATIVLFAFGPCLAFGSAFFHPGDAYFRSHCEKLEPIAIADGQAKLRFRYVTSDSTRILNGFSGYRYLNVVGSVEKVNSFVENVSIARKAVRLVDYENYSVTSPGDLSTATLVNPVEILIYNKNYNTTYPLFLKYNENWSRYEKIYGKRKNYSDQNYEPILEDYKAAMQDWKFAEEVSGLAVKGVTEESEWWTLKKAIDDELTINLDDCAFFVIPRGEAKDIFKQRKLSIIYKIQHDSVHRGKWHPSSIHSKVLIFKPYSPEPSFR